MIILFWVIFAVAVGVFASNRGRSGFGWFLLSLVISPILGLLFVAVSKDLSKIATNAGSTPGVSTHRKCPACAEWVLPEAAVCKHCGAQLTPDPAFHVRTKQAALDGEKEERINLLIGVGAIASVIGVAVLLSKLFG